jgi:hypothetical protein
VTYVETVLISLLCWLIVGLIIGYEFARVVRR